MCDTVYAPHMQQSWDLTPARHRRQSLSQSSVSSQSSISSYFQRVAEPVMPAATLGHHNAYGSFTTTPSASYWLHTYLNIPDNSKRRGKQREVGWPSNYDFYTPDSPDSPLSPSSPLRSPSISRTASHDDYFEDASTGLSSVPPSPLPPPFHEDLGLAKLHPILEAVEGASKLSSQTACVTCLKVGKDFPRCPRCSDMWCSRACRLDGGKKHVCKPSRKKV
ncbi:hypothetical protein BJ138DRAFT_1141876 [Hygrophoropsis aurantiaca]|uniref:Uncharacterized protein n=1 Tax=Hygrophoropsis aurantiaca TaxID=72124 RepID=A0ACB8AR41_9AGAM|nr:hypothetical protein BJ138DRAFT_1141876 [Hygrophoropsis aurantiaca]